jgi:OFA family oxalate/formate antiporter-like MFS transporter
MQSWLVPVLGYAVDRFGARFIVGAGGVLVGFSWIASGLAHTLGGLYLAYALGGVGVAAVYGASLGTILRWFPDRRGLAAGLAVGAYGSGAALTIVPIQRLIEAAGYRTAFVGWGVLQGLVVVALASLIAAPYPGWRPPRETREPPRVLPAARGFRPTEMVRTGAFGIMYVVAVLVTFGGLLVTAQLKPMAVSAGLDGVPALGGLNTLELALMANLAIGALARPFWGWLSDRVGRYATMMASFGLGGGAIIALIYGLRSPFWFVALSSLTIFAWGSSFVLFSAAVGDAFGSDYAATNTGIQYTSKGVAAIFAGWGAARFLEMTDSWAPVLWLAAGCNLLAAVLVLLSLRPAVARLAARRRFRPAARPAHSEGHGD